MHKVCAPQLLHKKAAPWCGLLMEKDSVKENRQGCLSRSIRAGTAPLPGGMRYTRHQKRTPPWGRSFLVPLTGIEPVRCFHRGILSPLRLPVPPQRRRAGINLTHLTLALRKSQAQGLTNPHRALYNTLKNKKKGIDRVSAAPPPPERKPPAERLSAVPVHHSRPRAIGVRNAGVPGALNRQKRQRPTALQTGWYHGRFGFRPYGFAKEAGEESCFLFFAHRPQNAKKKGIYPL